MQDLADRIIAHIDRMVDAAVSRRVEPLALRLLEVTRERDCALEHLNGSPLRRPARALNLCARCGYSWSGGGNCANCEEARAW